MIQLSLGHQVCTFMGLPRRSKAAGPEPLCSVPGVPLIISGEGHMGVPGLGPQEGLCPPHTAPLQPTIPPSPLRGVPGSAILRVQLRSCFRRRGRDLEEQACPVQGSPHSTALPRLGSYHSGPFLGGCRMASALHSKLLKFESQRREDRAGPTPGAPEALPISCLA